jgi:hypothetical protein
MMLALGALSAGASGIALATPVKVLSRKAAAINLFMASLL